MQRSKIHLSTFMRRGLEVIALALICLNFVSGTVADDGASKAKSPATAPAQTLKGILTFTGDVAVNDKPVKTGATVTHGDKIMTGPQADATIDLGNLGSVRLRPNTSLHLMSDPKGYELVVDRCGCITQTVPSGISARTRTTIAKALQVAVTEGEIWINRGDAKTGKIEKKKLKIEKPKTFHHVSQIDADGAASYTIRCCQCCFVEKINP